MLAIDREATDMMKKYKIRKHLFVQRPVTLKKILSNIFVCALLFSFFFFILF